MDGLTHLRRAHLSNESARHNLPRGLLDEALVFRSERCRVKSCQTKFYVQVVHPLMGGARRGNTKICVMMTIPTLSSEIALNCRAAILATEMFDARRSQILFK